MLVIVLTTLIGFFLAFANGSNDNFKGVATLYGSGVCNYKTALAWATVMQILGSMAALFLTQGLLATFSGKGLVPDSIISLPHFYLPVAIAGASTVMLATRMGFPVSTTHALTGALIGSGLIVSKTGIALDHLWQSFFTPLIVTPFIAVTVTIAVLVAVKKMNTDRIKFPQKIADRLHFLSSGAVCLSRGINDTPKIAALLLLSDAIAQPLAIVGVSTGMAVGGLVGSKKISETISHKITEMNSNQAFITNFVTSFLVLFSSKLGLPVSTTHISVGAIFGLGRVTNHLNGTLIKSIIFAWVLTLPAAILLGLISSSLFKLLL